MNSKNAKTILEEVKEAVANWIIFAKEFEVHKALQNSIAKTQKYQQF